MRGQPQSDAKNAKPYFAFDFIRINWRLVADCMDFNIYSVRRLALRCVRKHKSVKSALTQTNKIQPATAGFLLPEGMYEPSH